MGEHILINDIHLSDRAPASCTDTYLDDLFDLLDEAAEVTGRSRQTKSIILAGDVFHHKTPGRTSHSTVMRLIDWGFVQQDRNIPVYVVPGNHDMSHDRVDSVEETQPLGVVFASGAMQPLTGWMTSHHRIYGVPWQATFDDDTVFTALADYREGLSMLDPCLVVAHAPLYPPGQELPYEFFPVAQWARAMANIGTVHYGHVHENHGIYTVGEVTFSNCGALSRGSLTETNLTRVPSVAVWNEDSGLTQHFTLPAKPADDVFRLAHAREKKNHALDLSNFLSSVENTRIEVTSTASVLDHVRRTQDDPQLITTIVNLLESVEG